MMTPAERSEIRRELLRQVMIGDPQVVEDAIDMLLADPEVVEKVDAIIDTRQRALDEMLRPLNESLEPFGLHVDGQVGF